MKIASWNVAGLRACVKKGFYNWYLNSAPDVVCLQETKAMVDQLPEEVVTPPDHDTLYAPAKKRGYSGVSTWIHKNLKANSKIGLGEDIFDDEGRTIITEFKHFFLINCYFPNGQRDHARVPYKMDFCELVLAKAKELMKDTGKEIVITGDFNTAHTEDDLANPKTNKKTTGFLPNERAWMDKLLESGFIDAFRHFNPKGNGHYTWWTYRSNCRERNIGWRIDYFWVSKGLKESLKDCYHQIDILGSDHCPIVLEIDTN
ncbi:exodeoxyribonuclease III [Halobacteriovorax sp. GB3]|uniref:exodeoxyribonuclease III n=1 Tax=Halobacteriovorax sp. GB3 TaxID=2719615 RepID=UPI00235ED9A1|nr:exodeoxyribonuclease III [Halobacteriovorax sp. GB3]MDD0853168.1 exodeoxyribonuclease III [Halobacteriovorax sp. GB3]